MVLCTFRALYCFLLLVGGGAVVAQSPTPNSQPPARPPSLLKQMEAEVAVMVAQTQGSVVSIEGRITLLNFLFPSSVSSELMRQFDRLPPERRAEAERNFLHIQESLKSTDKDKMFVAGAPQAGSGFLIPSGFVVTTAEVMENLTEIVIVLPNGKRMHPQWINADPYSNIAVIKLETDASPGLAWGDSQRVKAGHFAVAIGNQAGFANSACLGLVSGINRSGRSGTLRYHGLIQFQGVVGAGNSGSPLLNSSGEVIGMVVATPCGDSELGVRAGMPVPSGNPQMPPMPNNEKQKPAIVFFDGMANTGFALPAHQLQPIVETLCKGVNVKPVRDGWLGISIPKKDRDGEMAARVNGIYRNSPAHRAGILPGDIVIAINGQPTRTLDAMRKAILNIKAGKTLRLDILRSGTQHQRTLTIEARPDVETINQTPVIEGEGKKK